MALRLPALPLRLALRLALRLRALRLRVTAPD
jgi:hypothetical protein